MPVDEAFWASFKFSSRRGDLRTADINQILHIETRTYYSCLVLHLYYRFKCPMKKIIESLVVRNITVIKVWLDKRLVNDR